MTEINPIQHKLLESEKKTCPFQAQGFGVVKTNLIAPLLAIAHSMFDSLKEELIGNSKLSTGISKIAEKMSHNTLNAVSVLQSQLQALYNATPKYDPHNKEAYQKALAANQAAIQQKQTEIQEVKSSGDAATDQEQSIGSSVFNNVATILKNGNSSYDMGKSVLNGPVNTVANMIASIGAPKT